MYYLMMKTALKTDLNSKTFRVSKSYPRLIEKEISLINLKLTKLTSFSIRRG